MYSSQTKYHIWIGSKSGIHWSSSEGYSPAESGKNDKIRYMGFTYDIGWPKRLNTGRVIHKPKKLKKRIKALPYTAHN